MKHSGQLEDLERLDLSHSPIDDDGLRYLSKLKKLKELNLTGTKITDAGLAHVPVESLEVLNLDGTSATDGADWGQAVNSQ